MKIYLAENTPGREREERVFLEKGLVRARLLAFHYLVVDESIYKILTLWESYNKDVDLVCGSPWRR